MLKIRNIVFYLFFTLIFVKAEKTTQSISIDEINSLKNQNIILSEQIKAVNVRIDDWYLNLAIGGSIFVLLLGVIITLQWIGSKNTARSEALKELESLTGLIENTYIKANESELRINSLVNSLVEMEDNK
jgi:hypothetical protein